MNINHKKNMYMENLTAVFIVLAVSFFILANFAAGFILPVYLFAMLTGFLLSAVFPRSGVYAIVFLTIVFERFFTLVPIFWGRNEYKIYPLDILLIGVLLGTIFPYFSRGKKFEFRAVDWLVALLLAASAAYFLASAYVLRTDFEVAFSTFKNYFFYGLFYFVILFNFERKENLTKLLKTILVGGIAATVFIFIGIFRGEGLWTEFTPLSTPGTRILAFPHAFYMSMAILTASAWIAQGKDRLKNILPVFIPLWFVGIVGSLMRHLWISVAVSLAAAYFLLPKERKERIKGLFAHYVFAAVALVLLVAYASMLFPNTRLAEISSSIAGITGERFVSTARVSTDESLNWRKNVWLASWKDLEPNLLWGIGYGKKVSVEIGTDYKDFVEVRNIHNSLLTIFIQMGSWVAVLLFFVFWSLLKNGYKAVKNFSLSDERRFLSLVFLALFVNYAIAFLFQTYLETNLLGIFFWIILGGLRITAYENIGNQQILSSSRRRG